MKNKDTFFNKLVKVFFEELKKNIKDIQIIAEEDKQPTKKGTASKTSHADKVEIKLTITHATTNKN